jgi:hypothetical protein
MTIVTATVMLSPVSFANSSANLCASLFLTFRLMASTILSNICYLSTIAAPFACGRQAKLTISLAWPRAGARPDALPTGMRAQLLSRWGWRNPMSGKSKCP